MRSSIHEELGRLDDATCDLRAVLAAEALFPGTAPNALVRLADLARREQDPDRAGDLLATAADLPDATDETLVEILIVRAFLLEQAGDCGGAADLWQSVVASPSATERQRSIATARGKR